MGKILISFILLLVLLFGCAAQEGTRVKTLHLENGNTMFVIQMDESLSPVSSCDSYTYFFQMEGRQTLTEQEKILQIRRVRNFIREID